MNHAFQSRSTLRELLQEAATFVASVPSTADRDLSGRIDELRRSLDSDSVPTADAEQEIMSIYVRAELERTRSRTSSYGR